MLRFQVYDYIIIFLIKVQIILSKHIYIIYLYLPVVSIYYIIRYLVDIIIFYAYRIMYQISTLRLLTYYTWKFFAIFIFCEKAKKLSFVAKKKKWKHLKNLLVINSLFTMPNEYIMKINFFAGNISHCVQFWKLLCPL